MTTPQEIAAAIEEALDLGGHLLIRFAHAQVRQLKSSEVELLVDTLKAAQPEDIERRALQPGGLRAQGRRFRLDREARDCIRQAGGYPHPRTAYD
jgi:hypothetical protein